MLGAAIANPIEPAPLSFFVFALSSLAAAVPNRGEPVAGGRALWFGTGNAPSLTFRVGSRALGSVMTPTSQPLAMIIAMWPCAKAASCLASSPVLSARERVLTRLVRVVRPCCELDEFSEPCHLPPDLEAMS